MSEIKNYNKFLDEIIKEVEDDLEESSATGAIDGYQTPNAFGDDSEKSKKKTKDVSTQAGYTVVDDNLKNINEGFSKPNAEAKKKLKGMYKLPAKQFHQTNDYVYYDKNKKQWWFVDTDGDLMSLNNTYYLNQIGDYVKKNNININEAEDRDYAAEYQARKKDYYKKYQSSDKAKKYRAELNQYNRKKGTYGNGDGLDASHKGGKIVGFETENKNRSRKEKSRLKKESIDGLSDAKKALSNVYKITNVEKFTNQRKGPKNYIRVDYIPKTSPQTQELGALSYKIFYTEPNEGDVILKQLKLKLTESVNEGLKFYDIRKGTEYTDKKGRTILITQTEFDHKLKRGRLYFKIDGKELPFPQNTRVFALGQDSGYTLKENNSINESSIPKPIQSLIDHMVSNKLHSKHVTIKDKSKHDMFMKDVQPAIDKKILMVKHNPINNNEIWISLGSNAPKLFEGKTPKRTNRWLELKNDESMHGHKKLATGLKELKYQLAEVEKFLGWYNKLKNINELDSDNYWKRTNNNIYKIKERLINIVKKIQEIEK
jgi:hypothetical protein